MWKAADLPLSSHTHTRTHTDTHPYTNNFRALLPSVGGAVEGTDKIVVGHTVSARWFGVPNITLSQIQVTSNCRDIAVTGGRGVTIYNGQAMNGCTVRPAPCMCNYYNNNNTRTTTFTHIRSKDLQSNQSSRLTSREKLQHTPHIPHLHLSIL
jgi:hypothetical protein